MRMIMWTLLTLSLAACGDSGGRHPRGPNDDTDPSGVGVCEAYVACATTATPADAVSLDEQYGEGGSCWDSNVDCDAACTAGLTDLQSANTDTEACFGAGYLGDAVLAPGSYRYHQDAYVVCDDHRDEFSDSVWILADSDTISIDFGWGDPIVLDATGDGELRGTDTYDGSRYRFEAADERLGGEGEVTRFGGEYYDDCDDHDVDVPFGLQKTFSD